MRVPGTGRWTSQDPLGFAAGDSDLFRYVGNDPENEIDSIGLEGEPWWTQNPNPQNPSKGWWWDNPVVREHIIDAWNDSDPSDPDKQHEEGGWIYWNPQTNQFQVGRLPPGKPSPGNHDKLHSDLPEPKPPSGFIPVGFFHTHPPDLSRGNTCERESGKDKRSTRKHNVPDLIISSPSYPKGRHTNPTDPDLPWQPNPYYPPGYPNRLK